MVTSDKKKGQRKGNTSTNVSASKQITVTASAYGGNSGDESDQNVGTHTTRDLRYNTPQPKGGTKSTSGNVTNSQTVNTVVMVLM